MKNSAIAWTDHTFNIVIGCEKISEACANCYAEALSKRFGYGANLWRGERKVLSDAYWKQPHAWEREAIRKGLRPRVFASSMCDVFDPHPLNQAMFARLLDTIHATPHLDWLLLTKRAKNLRTFLPTKLLDNIWLGVTVENAECAYRLDALRETSARVKFLSYEPALESLAGIDLTGLDWVIAGGESGPKARPSHPDWFREVRDKCAESGIPFFYKQVMVDKKMVSMPFLDGIQHNEFPKCPR